MVDLHLNIFLNLFNVIYYRYDTKQISIILKIQKESYNDNECAKIRLLICFCSHHISKKFLFAKDTYLINLTTNDRISLV